MRLLLVGAFPYPHSQGSQVYFQEQAIALRAAGAEIELLTYASGEFDARDAAGSATGSARDTEPRPPNRALDGFRIHRSPPWTSPRSLRAGPSWAKPLGDIGLGRALRHVLASRADDATHDASRPMRYDAVLAHNAEAALVALIAASKPRPPIVYCVHTLLGHELSTYAKRPSSKGLSGASSHSSKPFDQRVIDRSGRVIDRFIARRVDGWIALTQASARVMQQDARGPGALIPPPIPDPERDPHRLDALAVCTKHGLSFDRFFLYAGNLDPYQELDLLAAAAQRLAEGGTVAEAPALIVASHDPAALAWAESRPGLQACVVDSAQEMQALHQAARASLVLRRAVGGFPIKLANSLAAGTPAIAFHGREWGLEDGKNSLICDARDPAGSIANAIAMMDTDDALALRLSRGARQLYLDQHRPEVAAAETLTLLERIRHHRHHRDEIGDPPGV
jgi:glycosyltransferase involved in cell wall biosynthesis